MNAHWLLTVLPVALIGAWNTRLNAVRTNGNRFPVLAT